MTNMFAYFFKMNLKQKYIKLVYNRIYIQLGHYL